MAHRTYVPTLRFVVDNAYKYMVRWRPKLEANLTAPQVTCLTALISAAAECLVALGVNETGD